MRYKISLAVSLALNVILLGAFWLAPERESAPSELSSPPRPLASARQPRITFDTGNIPKAVETRRELIAPNWQQSLPQLRDAGVPQEVLAGLVISDFELRWQKQLREFEQRYQAGVTNDDDRARFEARRDDEQEQALRTALGDEGFRQWEKDHGLRDLDLVKLQLSSSQTDALYQLRKERAHEDRRLTDALRNGEIDEAEYNEQQSAAQGEYDQQFKLVLGDERYEALQNSEEGLEGSLRQQTRDLNLADSQLAALVAAERKASRDLEYKQLLGSTDFEQLRKNQDHRYQLLKRNANLWSLSETDIDYVYSSVQRYREQNPNARNQVEQSLMSYLGPERFERLKEIICSL